MAKSMTGFGRGESQKDGKEFIVEIKSVNHRYSDFFIKLPRQFTFFEDRVREVAGKYISRGKIDIYISYEDSGTESKEVLVDEPLLKAYIDAINLIKDKYGIKDDVGVSLFAKLPDVLRVENKNEDEEELWSILSEALEIALKSLVFMREKEGILLKESLLQKADFIESIIDEISKRSKDVVNEYKVKLENRIKELLEQNVVDETRLAMEVAIFADRCSIDEELVRLASHINQLRYILNEEELVGRKLDFLIQEMNREINTIGSKANDLSITKNVVEIKSEIEKMREQVQNLE